jgi:uncharacterized protein
MQLWQPRSRIGATLVNEVGGLCWIELATTDVERAKSFFGERPGWEYETDEWRVVLSQPQRCFLP